MCELRSQLPVQEGNLILSFCTCSQIPSLSQARIVPRLMERESGGKSGWVIISQPATKTSRYSKQDDSSEIHYFLYFLVALLHYSKVLHLTVLVLCLRQTLWLIRMLPQRQHHFRVRLWNYELDRNGFSTLAIVSQHSVSSTTQDGLQPNSRLGWH